MVRWTKDGRWIGGLSEWMVRMDGWMDEWMDKGINGNMERWMD